MCGITIGHGTLQNGKRRKWYITLLYNSRTIVFVWCCKVVFPLVIQQLCIIIIIQIVVFRQLDLKIFTYVCTFALTLDYKSFIHSLCFDHKTKWMLQKILSILFKANILLQLYVLQKNEHTFLECASRLLQIRDD